MSMDDMEEPPIQRILSFLGFLLAAFIQNESDNFFDDNI